MWAPQRDLEQTDDVYPLVWVEFYFPQENSSTRVDSNGDGAGVAASIQFHCYPFLCSTADAFSVLPGKPHHRGEYILMPFWCVVFLRPRWPTAIGIGRPRASALVLDNHIRSHHIPLLVKGCWTELETSPGIQAEAVGNRAILECQGFEEHSTQEDPGMQERVCKL